MSHPLPKMIVTQPPVEFVEEVCGIFFRSVFLEKSGMIVWQHVHTYDHPTFIGSGSVRLWVDEEWAGDFKAGHAVGIKAGQKHLFMALEPNTRLACVHSVKEE